MDPRKLKYPPTPDEVREAGRLVGSGAKIAELLHLGSNGGRTWRRWISGESEISFGNWFALNWFAKQDDHSAKETPLG